MKKAVFGLLFVFFALRLDFWAFADGRLILGLPIGLAYHALYCLVGAALLFWLGRVAWSPEAKP